MTPKKAGVHSTRSASLPGSTEPISWSRPCATAGLRVYFATYRRARALSARPSPGRLPRRFFMTCAVCQVRITTSPMRPMAWESELMIEMAPRSCRMSSAAMVEGRIRDSAKARSSGTCGLRWWQTISMSRCSSTVLTVCGRVGLVELGSTLGCETTVMMSGACPPPAPSVWYAWMPRPAIAARVSATNPASFNVSVWMASWAPVSSQTRRQASIAAGVAPQSS